jgi:hypothetical protein
MYPPWFRDRRDILHVFSDLSFEVRYLKDETQTALFNPMPALTYQNVLDLNVACRAKRNQTYWHVRKFQCLLKKRSLPAHAVGFKLDRQRVKDPVRTPL